MSGSLLKDAFAHHMWATHRLLDVCAELDAGALDFVAPGTYGSILDTLRHLVGADRSYLFVIGEGRLPLVEEEDMDLPQLRRVMAENGSAWDEVLSGELDPDRWLVRVRDDGSEAHAALGVRVAQVIHHGTDHRSQVCTALTLAGVEPPEIDLWDWSHLHGRYRYVEPPKGESS
jgi:uncharacterized damage-inducible protein DinB